MSFTGLEMRQNRFRPGLYPGPIWGAYSAPQTLVGRGVAAPFPRTQLPPLASALWDSLSCPQTPPKVNPRRYLMNDLNNLDETYREYSIAPTDDLSRFLRSKVKVAAGSRGGEGMYVNTGASKSIF